MSRGACCHASRSSVVRRPLRVASRAAKAARHSSKSRSLTLGVAEWRGDGAQWLEAGSSAGLSGLRRRRDVARGGGSGGRDEGRGRALPCMTSVSSVNWSRVHVASLSLRPSFLTRGPEHTYANQHEGPRPSLPPSAGWDQTPRQTCAA